MSDQDAAPGPFPAREQIEAVRQVRGVSTSQVPGVEVSMVVSGPMVTPVSSCIFGSGATL